MLMIFCTLERIVEDHELVKDVVSVWPKKSSTQLVVKELKDKHQLWLSTVVSCMLYKCEDLS